MALENGNNGTGMIMPVSPMYGGYGGGYGGGFGLGGDWAWILLLLLINGNGWGFGGFGGMMGMGMADGMMLYPWMNQAEITTQGFQNQALNTQISGLQSAVTSGFGDVQLGIAGINQNLCQTGNGIVSAVNGAQNAIAQQLYTNEIGSLNRSFAEQSANAQGFNAVQGQLAKCCCDNQLATVQTQNIVQVEAAANRAASSADTQKIMDKLCQLEIDNVRNELSASHREIATLQNQLNMAAAREDNARQTQQIENYIRPQINPAYVVPNPYAYNFLPQNGWNNCCNNGCNSGCGSF